MAEAARKERDSSVKLSSQVKCRTILPKLSCSQRSEIPLSPTRSTSPSTRPLAPLEGSVFLWLSNEQIGRRKVKHNPLKSSSRTILGKDSGMSFKDLVDVSPFLLFEATADSDQLKVMEYAIEQNHDDGDDDDDAGSCSCDVSDHSYYSTSCVDDDIDTVGASCTVVDDGYGGYEEGEVDEGEIFWPGHGYVEEKVSGSVDSSASKEVMMVSEVEKSRLFWETCLAS